MFGVELVLGVGRGELSGIHGLKLSEHNLLLHLPLNGSAQVVKLDLPLCDAGLIRLADLAREAALSGRWTV